MTVAASMAEVVRAAGELALRNGGSPEDVAWYWEQARFAPNEAQAWLAARCFDPHAAAMLRHAGITPDEAAISTTAGRAPGAETIGYKVSNGGLSVEQAERVLAAMPAKREQCMFCNGKGDRREAVTKGMRAIVLYLTCPECCGTGSVIVRHEEAHRCPPAPTQTQ